MIAAIPTTAAIVIWRQNVLLAGDPFPRLMFLFMALVVMLTEFYRAVDSYVTVRLLAIDWIAVRESDPSLFLAVECMALSIERSPTACLFALSAVIAALR